MDPCVGDEVGSPVGTFVVAASVAAYVGVDVTTSVTVVVGVDVATVVTVLVGESVAASVAEIVGMAVGTNVIDRAEGSAVVTDGESFSGEGLEVVSSTSSGLNPLSSSKSSSLGSAATFVSLALDEFTNVGVTVGVEAGAVLELKVG